MREKDQRNKKMPSSKSIAYRKNKGGSPIELPPVIVRCFAAADLTVILCYEKTVCSVDVLALHFSFIRECEWEGL